MTLQKAIATKDLDALLEFAKLAEGLEGFPGEKGKSVYQDDYGRCKADGYNQAHRERLAYVAKCLGGLEEVIANQPMNIRTQNGGAFGVTLGDRVNSEVVRSLSAAIRERFGVGE
jgi:hypothetical protein